MKSKSEVKSDLLFARLMKSEHPETYEQYQERLKQLPPTFEFYTLLPRLLTAYCELKQVLEQDIVGTGHGIEMNELKKKFVGAMILTYHPDMITGHDEKIKERLCKEISFILGCKREQISQYASTAINALKPRQHSFGLYREFASEINTIVEYLKERFKPVNVEFSETNLFQ